MEWYFVRPKSWIIKRPVGAMNGNADMAHATRQRPSTKMISCVLFMAPIYSVPLVGSFGYEKEPVVPISTYFNIVLFEKVCSRILSYQVRLPSMDVTRIAILSAVFVVNPDPHSKYRIFGFRNEIHNRHAFLEKPPAIVERQAGFTGATIYTTWYIMYIIATRRPKMYIHNFVCNYKMNKEIQIINGEALMNNIPMYVRKRFIIKVYSILTFQLLLTSFMTSIFTLNSDLVNWVSLNPEFPTIMSVISLLFICPLFCYHQRYPFNLILFIIFTFLQSLAVSSICSLYVASGLGNTVLLATMGTAGVFVLLSLFTYVSKTDFDVLHEWLTVSAIILFAMLFIGMWVSIPYLNLIISISGCIIFSGYIIYDTHQVLHIMGPDDAILGAIQLYLDLINLFLFMLSCLRGEEL